MYFIYLLLITTLYSSSVAGNLIDLSITSAKLTSNEEIANIDLGVTNKNETRSNVATSEDANLNTTEIVKKYGYPIEDVKVTTDDGYVLSLHRIPHGKGVRQNGLVVFLMHGILDSSASWILQGPDNALAYILADEGFDVWMGNARGNKYSRKHTTLDPKSSKFWEFTWEQIGLYDIPKMIDYVLDATRNRSLYYIGHSQGTTSFYVMNSLKPENNDKVKLMISLAPVAYMRHVKSPIVTMFSPANKLLSYLLSNLNTNMPTTDYFNKIGTFMCKILLIRCDSMLTMVIGSNYKLIDNHLLPVIFGHLPSGSSTLQFVHYGQLVVSGRFCRYDYGKSKNVEIYGIPVPPEYDLSKVLTPVVLFYSGNDWLSDPTDIKLLRRKLPHVYEELYLEDFNHLDYMYATTAREVIYSRIVKQIYSFENNTETLSHISHSVQ